MSNRMETLANLRGTVINGYERIASAAIMKALGEPAWFYKASHPVWRALAAVMRHNGWEGPRMMALHGKIVRGYMRPDPSLTESLLAELQQAKRRGKPFEY